MDSATSFDPFQQNFTLQDTNGTPFNVSLADVDAYRLFGTQESIALGVQIGASAILLIVLLLLTKPDKRWSAIFILNTLALALDVIRCVLGSVYWTSPFVSTYAQFGQDFSQVTTGLYAQQVTATVCILLLQICVEISLCIQAYVVFVNSRPIYRQAVIALSALIALAAVAVRFALMVENDIYIVQLKELKALDLLDDATNITTTICICWFCAIFVGKLGVALRERKKIGMDQFGPMQIIFIVGCQSLVIPVVFCVMSFYVGASLDSFVLTTVALSLPLSSLWASAALDGRFRQSQQNNFGPQMIAKRGGRSTGPMADRNTISGPISPTNSSSTRVTSNLSSPRRGDQQGAIRDLEAQGLADTGDLYKNA
ncbi:pheromone alpha factor receptor [Lecanora helva]